MVYVMHVADTDLDRAPLSNEMCYLRRKCSTLNVRGPPQEAGYGIEGVSHMT